jgi:hypothetical protein
MSRDSHETSFREGERNVVLYILTLLNVGEPQLEQMIEEASHDHPTQSDAVSS